MRGFMGLVNQSTFCLSPDTRKLMEKLKDTLKSTKLWEWSESNQKTFEALKTARKALNASQVSMK